MDNDGYDSDHISVRDLMALPHDEAENTVSSLSSTSDEENVADASNQDGRATTTLRNTFDNALPLRHSYLGDNLEELHGRTVLEEGSTVLLPLLPQQGLVLVPGQTFPMSVSYPQSMQMLRLAINTNRTFGVVCVRILEETAEPIMAEVGTTAEIFAYEERAEPNPALLIKATGRQRFRLLDMVRQEGGNFLAQVLILPEVVLPDLLRQVSGQCWLRRHRATRRHATALTRWPTWVYRMYDPECLVMRMRAALKHLETDEKFHIPSDATELSYWACRTLPLPDERRVQLLSMHSAVQRLQAQLETLDNYQVVCCAGCKRQIADKRDVFSMSCEGPQGTYINPGGYIHEIVTLHRATGLVIQTAQPSFEYSWFQGYGWTIVDCRTCSKHMGWLFTTTQQRLHPKSFFGLCRQSLVVKTDIELATDTPQLFA